MFRRAALLRWILTAGAIVGPICSSVAGEIIESAKVLEVVRAHEAAFEARVRTARWNGNFIRGELLDRERLDRFRPIRDAKEYGKCTITFEPPSGRYRIDIEQVSPWHKGVEDYAGLVRSYSYDGKTERRYQRSRGGTELPPLDQPGSGWIAPSDFDQFLRHFGGGPGLGNFPPHFLNRRFSAFLQERVDAKSLLRTEQHPDGSWLIETTADPGFRATEVEDSFITYDPSHGLVHSLKIHCKPTYKSEWGGVDWAGKLTRLWRIKWKEWDKGLWLPEYSEMINVMDRQWARTEYRDMRINEPVDQRQFTLQFPLGTHVIDEVEKEMYHVSSGVIDEQAAIKAFMDFERLKEGAKPSFWRRWRIYIAAAVGVVFLAAAGGWYWRRRRAAAIAAMVSILVSVGATAAAEPDPDGSWRVSHQKGESYAISQCGLNVALFALEYFDVKYNVKSVSLGLPPSEEGIRFQDVKTMLEAHGLQVTARDKVTLGEFRRALRPGTLAIFPTRVGPLTNHYLVAIEHSERGRLLIDAPHSVELFDDRMTEPQWNSLGGIVLFAQRRSVDAGVQADRMAVSRATIDMGTFDPRRAEAFNSLIREPITLENKSDAAVMVTVQSPCGCLKTDWSGGIIPANEKREVRLTVLPAGWGLGRMERKLSFAFADGSSITVPMVATTVKVEEERKLVVQPPLIRVLLDERLAGLSVIERSATITLAKIDPQEVTVRCEAPWLSAAKVPAPKGHLKVRVEVKVDRLDLGALPATGDILVAAGSGEAPERIQVVVSRPQRFYAEPSVTVVSRAQGQPVSVRLLSHLPETAAPPGFALVNAAKGLGIERVDKKDGQVVLKVTCQSSAAKGFHSIRCRIGPDEKTGDIVALLVQVTD